MDYVYAMRKTEDTSNNTSKNCAIMVKRNISTFPHTKSEYLTKTARFFYCSYLVAINVTIG